jgi:hypothetical protein
MATATLYSQLRSSLLECPLGGQQFLPLNDLDKNITRESVQAELPWKERICQRNLTNKVVGQAKKVFAILVLADNPLAIKELLKEGLTDENLPLSRKGYDSSNILVSVCGRKTFRSFDVPKNEAKVTNFLDKQWTVLAPVLDTTGKYFILDQKCALPFSKVEPVGGGHSSTVYQSTSHPAHQHGFKVSVAFPTQFIVY